MCKAIEEMLEKYRAEVEKEMVEEITKKNRKEFAQRLLVDGELPLEKIVKYSGLSLEEVLQLKEA